MRPHEQANATEQLDRSLRLAGIVMRPSPFPYGANCGVRPPELREARRRMLEARWDDALPPLDAAIADVEAAFAERRRVEENISAGRSIDDHQLRLLLEIAGVTLAVRPERGFVTDANGNLYVVAHWDSSAQSPWRELAVPAYRAILAKIALNRLVPTMRRLGELVWGHMTNEERALFGAAA